VTRGRPKPGTGMTLEAAPPPRVVSTICRPRGAGFGLCRTVGSARAAARAGSRSIGTGGHAGRRGVAADSWGREAAELRKGVSPGFVSGDPP
jgi:hypothetical protein